jgi:hypothetical protein
MISPNILPEGNRTVDVLVEASTVETELAAGAPIVLPSPLSEPRLA